MTALEKLARKQTALLVPVSEWPILAWSALAHLLWLYCLPGVIAHETRFGMWMLSWAGYWAFHPLHEGELMAERKANFEAIYGKKNDLPHEAGLRADGDHRWRRPRRDPGAGVPVTDSTHIDVTPEMEEKRQRATAAIADALSPLFGAKGIVGVSLVALVAFNDEECFPIGMTLGINAWAVGAVGTAAHDLALGRREMHNTEQMRIQLPEKN